MPQTDGALQLYVAHRGELVNYANRILGDHARAEDVVQEAWVKLNQFSRREQVARPLNLLFTIVRNLSIDCLRSTNRTSLVESGDLDETAHTIPDPEPSAEVTLIAKQELTGVLDSLQALPERQRKAIELYRFQGLKLREIAEELGISTSLAHTLVIEGLALCSALRAKRDQ